MLGRAGGGAAKRPCARSPSAAVKGRAARGAWGLASHAARLPPPPTSLQRCAARSPNRLPNQESVTDPAKLREVKRVLYGFNAGEPVATLQLPPEVATAAASSPRPFDLQAYSFRAATEELRLPRVVRVGLVQNAVTTPTTAPFEEQRQVGTCLCLRVPTKIFRGCSHGRRELMPGRSDRPACARVKSLVALTPQRPATAPILCHRPCGRALRRSSMRRALPGSRSCACRRRGGFYTY